VRFKSWIPQLVGAPLAFMLAVGSVGSLITGYGLPMDGLWKLFLWCALAAIVSAVLLRFCYDGRLIARIAGVVLAVLLAGELVRPYVWKQIQTLCYLLTSHYHDVYNWPVLGTADAESVAVPLILWAALVSAAVNWHICRRKHILVALIPAVIPAALCLVTADIVPHTAYLYLLLLGLAILLITDWTRRKQPAQGMKLLLWSALPVALCLVLIFAFNPKGEYTNRVGKIQKEVVEWYEKFQNVAEAVISGTPIDDSGIKKRNLRTVGERGKSTRSVMFVTSPIDGTLYLRERDYDVYTGLGWESTAQRKEEFTAGTSPEGRLTIVTYGVKSVLYTPYYANEGLVFTGGAVDNEENLQKYSYDLSRTLSQKTNSPNTRYKKLPAETQAWAKNLARLITVGVKTDRERILKIQNFVRNTAIYDPATSKMNGDYGDFAQWFLEESETGYCVHYATAATVLLRAAGIPARYVEGYIVDCRAGEGVAVTKQEAHAWVEYYDWVTRAWYVLEATPAYPKAERPVVLPGKPLGDGSKPDEWEEAPELPTEDEPVEDQPIINKPLLPTIETEETETPTIETEETETPTIETEETETPDTPPQTSQSEPRKMPRWIKIALGCLIGVGCIMLQGYGRIRYKRKLWNSGPPNVRAVRRWRQTRSMAKLLKQTYPEELNDLAQKAVFSQHQIQPEELEKYNDYRATLILLIAEKPWYQKPVFLFLLAIR